ncbi:MAG: hypothetical protein M3N14_00235 [Bacteroidota bacterium]|nr:hypothetical protein [Bacteroidota bacterium]
MGNIREYYKDGKIKFVGQFDPNLNTSMLGGNILLEGDCISYYHNGKKQSINHYVSGDKDGIQYFYYPNGQIYCTLKYIARYAGLRPMQLKWDCYNLNGAEICKAGNGQWVIYDADYKNISCSGSLKNGQMDGEWHGVFWDIDSIKYVLKFKEGVRESGIGYDRAGIAYPFTEEKELTNYDGGVILFIERFKNHLHLPKNADGKKQSVDSLRISFTVEKDGHTSGFDVLGTATPELKVALSDAMAKCQHWLAGRLYGLPYRTKITIPLIFSHGYQHSSYEETVIINQKILGF